MTKFGILKSKMEQKLLESYSNGTFPQEMQKFKKLVSLNEKANSRLRSHDSQQQKNHNQQKNKNSLKGQNPL